MIRSILVALDDTPGAQAARDAAIALARRTGAALTAAVVLDRPHTADEHEPVPIGAGAFKVRRDAAMLRRAEAEAEAAIQACAAAADGFPFTPLRLEEAPEPALLRAGAAHDLLVLGRDCTLGREQTEDDIAPVIEALLRDGARPLLVVPPGPARPADGPVVVGYDGSRPAMRALQLFALLGLAEGSAAKVVSVAEDRTEAERLAGEAIAYLRAHAIEAEALTAEGARPSDLLLAEADALHARLLAMGAFGTAGLRSLLLGSTTHRLLHEARCPVFLHH